MRVQPPSHLRRAHGPKYHFRPTVRVETSPPVPQLAPLKVTDKLAGKFVAAINGLKSTFRISAWRITPQALMVTIALPEGMFTRFATPATVGNFLIQSATAAQQRFRGFVVKQISTGQSFNVQLAD